MDQTENQKKSQFHRNFIRFLLSVSVFSLFFSLSYWLSLLHSFTFNFHNTFPFQLFSHTIDKNSMFLFCNGLLVFLAKYSGLINSSKYNLCDDDDHQSFKSYEEVPRRESVVLEPKAPFLEKEVALENDEAVKTCIAEAAEPEIETQNFTLVEEEEDGEKWSSTTNGEEQDAAFVGEDKEELKGPDDDIFVQDFRQSEDSDVELVERNRVLSTEELNKKFDEFIRKMKEELRIEFRQQVVMV